MFILKLFILFIIYAILGWILETLEILIFEKRLLNRGFLIGPYCPIYGIGCVLLILLLKKYCNDPVAVFALSLIICASLEYFTSWLLEKIFKLRWWDYSHNKYHINGRISLKTMIPFGVGGTIVVCYFNPILLNLLDKIPNNIIIIISAIVASLFILDNIISIHLIFSFKKIAKKAHRDDTEDIKKYVAKHITSEKSLYNRLLNSFPKLHMVSKKKK